MGKFAVDANFLITPWYLTYPIDLFPDVWKTLAEHKDKIILIDSIFKEIEPPNKNEKDNQELYKKNLPLRDWLEDKSFKPFTAADNNEAACLLLNKRYETNEDSNGANKIDIELIVNAKQYGFTVATLEGEQSQKPLRKDKYKIPLICLEENVNCINSFVDLMRELKKLN